MKIKRLGLVPMLMGAMAVSAFAGEYSVDDGRLLASNCFQCHGVNGKPGTGGFDDLAGEDDIYKELLEMRAETSIDREEELMATHAKFFTLTEMDLISKFFAKQQPAPGGDD